MFEHHPQQVTVGSTLGTDVPSHSYPESLTKEWGSSVKPAPSPIPEKSAEIMKKVVVS